MELENKIHTAVERAYESLFNQFQDSFQIQPTNKEFEGSFTLVCFPLAKIVKKSPEETARLIGDKLIETSHLITKYNVVKGFLNLVVSDSIWMDVFTDIHKNKTFGKSPSNGEQIMVEYSSPNTNKPLHLGHLRNNFLGWSVASIYQALGYTVHKVQIINDRGIHICKSMAAWQEGGKNETPESTGLKGDKLVGKFYVEFDRLHKAQIRELVVGGMNEEQAGKEAPIMRKAVDMLQRWEKKEDEIIELWRTMNGWVYKGFANSYQRMGVDFDKLYYESETYQLGKTEVLKGLEAGVFYKKEDGSVWVDLSDDGLDQKVLLRSDGTSIYMTQDVGTAILRYRDFPKIRRQVYTVGNEQEYHFKVLFLILAKLGYAWAKECYHLSYGMVDLPTGKMKSREGTVVDADELMDEMLAEAARQTKELGKVEEFNSEQLAALHETIGMGALKYFLLKVDPKKRMLFDPNESIQLQGHTGPFIQYTYARIRSILRKADSMDINRDAFPNEMVFEPSEREVIIALYRYSSKIKEAAFEYSPAVLAAFVYDLAKEYNQFYQSIPIFNEADSNKISFRVALSDAVARTIAHCMGLLGINTPEKM